MNILLIMKTAKLFEIDGNQAILLPKEFELAGVSEVLIVKKDGALIITPKRKSWTSFPDVEIASNDYLIERPKIIE